MEHLRPNYDCIIVGAGISGLYVARELAKKRPSWSIAICERYKGLGGRTYSYWPPDFDGVQWEMGAGRIRKDHAHLMKLIKEYGLTFVPIPSGSLYKAGPKTQSVENPFEDVLIPLYIQPLSYLDKSVLANHTIEELLIKTIGAAKTKEILSYFPYRAEVTTLRADIGLQSFLGGEMGSVAGYGVLKEGFSTLIKHMRQDCEARGVVVLNRHRVRNLHAGSGSQTLLTLDFGKAGEPRGTIQLAADKLCVLALHRDAVAELPAFRGWNVLKQLKTQPLLRTYAIFDTKKPVWFSGLGKIVTPERPRYIIPIDPSKGVIMISYTDADDTKQYAAIQKRGGDKALEKAIMADIRALFPDLSIPNPVFFRSHLWDTGCTYWLPGSYDPETVSHECINPAASLPGVRLCGESWSMHQAWVEGALEHAEECLKEIL